MGAAAVPIALAGSSILGGILSRGGGKSEPTAQEKRGIESSFGQAGILGQAGGDFTGRGQRDLNTSSNFFNTLATGDRGALLRATSPEQQAITSSFRGSEQNIREQGRGGTRDLALAQLSRDRGAAQAGLLPQIRSNAAAQVGQLGLAGSQIGLGATANAGNLFQGLAATSQAGRLGADQIAAGQQQGGGQLGGFLFDILNNSQSGGSKGGGFTPGPGTIEARPPGGIPPGGITAGGTSPPL